MSVGKSSFDKQPLVVARPHDRDRGRQDLNPGKPGQRLLGADCRGGGGLMCPRLGGRCSLRSRSAARGLRRALRGGWKQTAKKSEGHPNQKRIAFCHSCTVL